MTRAEAIELLVNATYSEEWQGNKQLTKAQHMAIDALGQEPIIYCKDCKQWHEWENGTGSCHRSDIMWVGSDYDDFCSFAERMESDTECELEREINYKVDRQLQRMEND